MAVMMEVLEWVDMTGTDMIHRIPEKGSTDIKAGAQLIVRESQSAVFFKSGKGHDVLGPGRHTLTSLNVPILTRTLSLPWGFKSPIRCEIYFINHKIFTNLKWGTRDPVAFRDKELGLVRLRGYGAYTCRIVEPLVFLNSIVGRESAYTTEDISNYLRDVIVARINDLFGEKLETIFDLPKQYDELALEIKEKIRGEFSKYGLELIDFYITSITPPDEVQRMIDEKSSMKAVGDLDKFLKYSMAKALSTGGDSGQAGAGMGMAAGVGLMVPAMLSKAFSPDERNLASESLPTVTCPKCGKDLLGDANYCSSCGKNLTEKPICSRCKTKLPPGSKFCTNCGEKI